jgi:signal transduction histidine kinase
MPSTTAVRRNILLSVKRLRRILYEIEVQDFGEGIDEKNLPKVWDRYYKIDKEHVRVSNGSGIGLALCNEILEMHHAKYGVESKVGRRKYLLVCLPNCKVKEYILSGVYSFF